MKIRKATSGIQRKYLKYTIGLLLLALFLSSMGVWFYMRNIMMGIVTDKYTFMTEKTGISLDNLYQKTEKVTEECILNDQVQQSLKAKPMEEVNILPILTSIMFQNTVMWITRKIFIPGPIRRFPISILLTAFWCSSLAVPMPIPGGLL